METKYNRIAEILERKNRSIYWLSRVLGVADATAWRWVSQERQPSIPQLYEVAAALGVSAKTLLETDGKIYEQLTIRIDQIRGESKVYPRKRGRKKRK